MASLNTKTLPQLVQGMAAAVQGLAAGLLDFSLGSILLSVTEGYAAVVLWLEALILAVLVYSRASTAVGVDLDSWIADWGTGPTATDASLILRFQAVGSIGSVTFYRLSTTGQVVVPFGATVSSLDGTQQYAATTDPTNAAYSLALGGYVMAIGVSSVTVTVQAVTPGAASNAVAGGIAVISSAIPGVDSVTNASAFTNGANAETDPAFLSRFRSFMASLREATPRALAWAITNLQRGVACVWVENFQYGGTAQPGFFYYVVDDGSGSPPASLITAAGQVLDMHRAAGVEFGVYAPVVVPVNVSMTLSTTTTSTHANVVALVLSAVTAYLNALPLATPVYYSRLWQIAHDASPDVVEIVSLTLTGGTPDVAITSQQVAKAGTIAIT